MSLESVRAEWLDRFGRSEPKIVCVGLNYRDHAEEQVVDAPERPLLFAKASTALAADGDPIAIPASVHVDAEAELAVVIGRRARGVAAGDALDVVAGYTCANDVSARDYQFADKQWFRAKSHDGFCPVGPRIVPVSELGEAGDLRIVQRVNGGVLQESRTSQLIFGVRELIAYASAFMTLEPGDLMLTGTPAGVGYFRDPRVSLRVGDKIEVEVDGIRGAAEHDRPPLGDGANRPQVEPLRPTLRRPCFPVEAPQQRHASKGRPGTWSGHAIGAVGTSHSDADAGLHLRWVRPHFSVFKVDRGSGRPS